MSVPYYPSPGKGYPMLVVPGEHITCIVTIKHRGPGGAFWVGICPSVTSETRGDIYQYIGGMVTFDPSSDWVDYPITIDGDLFLDPPDTHGDHECYVLIGYSADAYNEVDPAPGVPRGDSRWMRHPTGTTYDVFRFLREDEFQIAKATFR